MNFKYPECGCLCSCTHVDSKFLVKTCFKLIKTHGTLKSIFLLIVLNKNKPNKQGKQTHTVVIVINYKIKGLESPTF